MRNLKIIFGLFAISLLAIIITGVVLNYIGIEHGSLLIKIGSIFILVNLTLYLIVLIFSVLRNIMDVLSEKRQRAIGSKFRTRLVISFLGLVLIPSIFLFILSYQLINNSIDTWFSLEVQKPVYDSMDIAKNYYLQERQNTLRLAKIFSANPALIERDDIKDNESGNFSVYMLNMPDGSYIVNEAFKGKPGTDIVSSEEGDVIRAAAPVIAGDRIVSVVVVETVIPHDLVGKMEQIRMAFNDYLQIKLRQRPIRIVYFLMLTIATLMIIFLALWVSLRIAKGITVPIKHLASATERVASGDLDFRIDFRRDDEIGMLINSFNSMLEEIKSKRESLEKAYGEAERRRLSMEVILENIRSGVIFFNASHNVETVNNAALELLSIDRKSLLGLNFIKLLKRLKSERLFDMAKRLIENRTGSIKEDIRTYIDGRPMDFRVYITVMNDSHGKFMGTLVVFDNLTDVVMEQRVRAWQEVARRIAHEIKNPLTPIILSAERLKRKWEERSTDFADVLNKSTKIIITEGNRLKSLINEFSKFGKMPKINPQPTDIASMIEDVVELYSNSKNAEIITQIDGDLPQVEIDRQQMKMVLINMIDNAVQADADKIWISARYNDKTDSISLEIADNGRGISVEDKNKIFEPYFSTRKDGTGLGLAIANNIILSHRGYIIVKDNIPKGSQFIINLPVNHG